MIIGGKILADSMLDKLARQTEKLKALGVTPTLAVILVGDDPASLAYIKQKQKTAERIGAKVILSNTLSDVERFNADPHIHGLIVQRPVPNGAGAYKVNRNKDVDGFESNSPFDVPVALAVDNILKSISNIQYPIHNMVVIGRGDTAGKPIADFFQKQKCNVSTVHSQTPNPQKIIQSADIVISCVGKERVVTKDIVKPGAVLISVGIWRDSAGKLRGDYNESDIADIASWYTPTPGGVGPVNVACLMQNLVKAAQNTH